MANDTKMSMPGVFGGIMRYDEEFESRFKISPAGIIGFIIGIVVFVIALGIFFPVK